MNNNSKLLDLFMNSNKLSDIFPILQRCVPKLCIFTTFNMLFLAVGMDFVLLKWIAQNLVCSWEFEIVYAADVLYKCCLLFMDYGHSQTTLWSMIAHDLPGVGIRVVFYRLQPYRNKSYRIHYMLYLYIWTSDNNTAYMQIILGWTNVLYCRCNSPHNSIRATYTSENRSQLKSVDNYYNKWVKSFASRG